MAARERPASDPAGAIAARIEAALLQHDDVVDCAVVVQDGGPADDRHCARCGITARYPGISFDSAGVCGLCEMYAANAAKIGAYWSEPEVLVRRLRAAAEAGGPAHDCLLLFSGGKDSTYALYRLVDLGLRVMTFTFDNGFISTTALRNVERVTAALGVEHVTANRADQKRIFLESLQRHKSVCNGCFRSLLELSTELAHRRRIPTIVTGLSRGQIIDERLSWFHRRGVFDPEEIDHKLAVGRGIYHGSGGTIDPAAVEAVEVVDFFRYSGVTKDEIRDFLRGRSAAWTQPGDTGFCSSNCVINDAGVYVHTRERGFHNYEAPTRWEVRLGHLRREEADAELRAPLDEARVQNMLAHIGYAADGSGGPGDRLTAYYVTRGEADPDVRAAVARLVPAPLLPAQWLRVDRIPRASGAVVTDRLAPPRPTRFGAGPAAERHADGDGAPDGLTPARTIVLEGDPAARERRARALLLESAGPSDPVSVRKATLDLLLRHDALRTRFAHRAGEWHGYDGGLGGPLPFLRLDLSGHEAHIPDLVPAIVERIRSRLRLDGGPLLRVALIRRDPRTEWLLLVIHELIADVPSWRPILAGLCSAWQPPVAGHPREAPAPVRSGRDVADPADPAGLDEPGETARIRVRCPARSPVQADAVLSTLAPLLAECLGDDRPTMDVLDHTRHGERREVGAYTVARPMVLTPGAAPAPAAAGHGPVTGRYEHFGDLAGLLPPGAPLALDPAELVDYTVLPGPDPYTLSLGCSIRNGTLRLDWRCGDALRRRLLRAGVPDRAARLLREVVGDGTPR
ncbi:hypothetical protein GCM10029978_055180 [Actinoallomurus acanthiterrae]